MKKKNVKKVLLYLSVITLVLLISGIIIFFSAPTDEPEMIIKGTEHEGYLIITRSMFLDTLSEFISWKENEGFNVETTTVEEIIINFEGNDIPEKIRNFLKTKKGKLKYVLFIGDVDSEDHVDLNKIKYVLDKSWEIPSKYIWSNIANQYALDNMLPTDQYYVSVDIWDSDNKIIKGSSDSEINFKSDFYVGIFPVKTKRELIYIIDLKNY